MNIVIFCDSIRPFEHISGLAIIAEKSKNHKIYFVSKNKNLLKKIDIKTKDIPNISNYAQKISRDIFLILSADIIFGSPGNWRKQFLRFTSLFLHKRFSIQLRAGKVTKPSGMISSGNESLINLLVQYASYKLFHSTTLVADKSDMIYCKYAYSKPISAMKIFPSPKLISMTQNNVNKLTPKNIILFSPTHRSYGEKSPLDNLLLSEKFLKKLKQPKIILAYTSHPSSYKFHKPTSNIQLFDEDWSRVKCVVTDYSSIGADFSLCGGNVIYYIPDFVKFFRENGEDFFFKNEIKDKTLIYKEDELIRELKSVTYHRSAKNKQSLNTYFDDIYQILKE